MGEVLWNLEYALHLQEPVMQENSIIPLGKLSQQINDFSHVDASCSAAQIGTSNSYYGGFGKVNWGVLCDGTKVTLKRSKLESSQGIKEFQTEIEMLSQLRYPYLVSLIGYCDENNELILIYEYMENGNLSSHLYGSDLPSMSWEQRLEICIGAARGLHYLHTSRIIHCDVKSANILLDEDFVAKVADFGLSKTSTEYDETHLSTVACSRSISLPREQLNLAEWAMNSQKGGQLKKIIDPNLVGKIRPDSLRKFGETAVKCLADSGVDRPCMGEVLWSLEYALRLQEPHTMGNKHSKGTTYTSDPVPQERFQFPFVALQEATNNFDESLVIGVGGFGKVYRGVLCDGTKVALKRRNREFRQSIEEFQTEIEILSQFRHPNLVSLIGYCNDNNEMILIFAYLENGNLGSHLYGTDLPSMSWEQRLEICIGAARDLEEATNNFDDKGVLCDGTKVALKRCKPESSQVIEDFQTEIEMLSHFRHPYLVSLIGYCDENNVTILIFEYMENGNLSRHLYGSYLPTMSWEQRLEICIGAARGLHYLHNNAVIHCDVKSTNILLDENFVAKITDFGLSKTRTELDQTHVSTVVKGTLGYLDPEYLIRGKLTEKSDVYSFGVVLFEVLCARPAIGHYISKEMVSLAAWAIDSQKEGQLEQIVDPNLAAKIRPESLRKFGETAVKCLADSGVDRPSMRDVLWNLEYALHLQEPVIQDDPEENSTILIGLNQ
ncbi:hypothetical protein H5410_026176 [Solanum commersonii]|uniref:Protein kinase domain-containing protein n=1 Tax=Solanum commersonii TaxID=4109 RepID=A0A9J5Z019_SOLCO|nr:hypothetical protein H5410_026176 [Solanum commersonii]